MSSLVSFTLHFNSLPGKHLSSRVFYPSLLAGTQEIGTVIGRELLRRDTIYALGVCYTEPLHSRARAGVTDLQCFSEWMD